MDIVRGVETGRAVPVVPDPDTGGCKVNGTRRDGRWAVAGGVLLLAALATGCGGGAPDADDEAIQALADEEGERSGVLPGGAAAPPPSEVPEAGPTERDLEIFRETMDAAFAARLDTLPIGEIIVGIGRRFVGEPYTPGTLELPGAERLVVNLREFDCVTYVESVLAMARLVRSGERDFGAFQRELARIRYREGRLDGYPSRLHYFSEWISDNEAKGVVQDVTRQLGGTRTDEPVTFMTSNAGAYPHMADPANVAAIREVESRLSTRPRWYIPQRQIASVERGIRTGDVIAATSSVHGLDVAHTGFALWQNGRVYLMHAPLVGSVLEISVRPLADRIQGISGQDGVMVARPQ
jgi:hypothetical protein